MTDIIERAGKALEDYEKNKKEWRHGFAKELFATPALTLLPEAVREIERLRYQLRGLIVAAAEEDKLTARAEAAEAKVAKLEAAIAEIKGEKP